MIKNILLIITSFLMLCCFGSSNNESMNNHFSYHSLNDKKNIPKFNDSIPILIMRSFLNPTENISKNNLTQLISNGNVYCTTDLVEELKIKRNFYGLIPILTKNFKKGNDSTFLITSLDSVDYSLLATNYNDKNFFKTPNKYDFWIKSNSTFSYESQITKYTHTGVTALTRRTGMFLDKNSTDYYLENILPYFQSSEITHISNEVSLVDDCDYSSMRLKFATKKEHFNAISKINTSIVELTGNHNLDFGKPAYLNSLEWYKKNNISYFGGGKSPRDANKPLVKFLKDSTKVAWIGFNEYCPLNECADKFMGANRYLESKAKTLIDSLKKQSVDVLIACIQFGETDSYSPTSSQKRICKKLIDFGADVIYGSQAHQPQEIALYKNKLIFYGLGNFMFDQIHRLGVRQAFFLECYFYKNKLIQCQPVYTFMSRNRQPNIASETEKKEIQKLILKSINF